MSKVIKKIIPLDFMWPVQNPFLFFAHHRDIYPKGNENMGPSASLSGRNIGNDFTLKDGWRMYHGESVPGFPVHPHRGFETITIVLVGFVDHSDSYGQAGRYGQGDVQWMTAGKGLQHCEMFPLLNTKSENPLELFQIWLNLPKEKKYAEPYYKMLWSDEIVQHTITDNKNNKTHLKIICGKFNNISVTPAAPDSWATDINNQIAVFLIKMDANAVFNIPTADKDVNRSLYIYKGSEINIDNQYILSGNAIELNANENLSIINGNTETYMVLLQGKPILDTVVQYGPFVMNTHTEIQQTLEDYRKTQFGGWHWQSKSMVFPREKRRFAKYKDGTEEIK